MATLSEIRDFPDCVRLKDVEEAWGIPHKEMLVAVRDNCSGIHQSTLRSWQVLQKVKELASRGVPSDVLLELITEMGE